MLVIWEVSANIPSQTLDVTYIISLSLDKFKNLLIESTMLFPLKTSKRTAFGEVILEGNKLYNVVLKNTVINMAKGILLLLLLVSSDILTLISISINRNNIETAPT